MNLVKIENKNTMTSREVAEITGKEHKNVLRDIKDEIEKLEKQGIRAELIFELSEYTDNTGRKLP
jgi:phage regulatory protein, rha family|nr:MAG TPA: regulatory protein [Caudoviricetes sp.]